MNPRHPIRFVVAVLALAAAASLAAPAGAAPIKLPPATRVQLKNGLRVVILPTQRLPLVDFRLVADAGAVRDPAGKEGLASLTAELLTQGAGPRNAQQIAEDIAFVGGSLQAAAGAEQLVMTCEVLKKDFGTGLELLRDCAVSPKFATDEFDRKKAETLGALAAAKDDPGEVADRALLPFVMGSSPLGHPADGWEKSVSAITRDDVVAHHRAWVTPDHALLTVVGDVDPKATVAALEKAFAQWKPSGRSGSDPVTPLPRSASARAVEIVSKPEVTQTQIRLACPGIARNDPDYFPTVVANTILGGGFTSRLVNEIRVTQGLTYGIGSGFSMYRNAGMFRITTFTKNETLRRCVDETIKVIRALVDRGPSDEELAKARRFLTGQYPLGLQAPDDLAARLADVQFFGLDPRFIETYSDRVNAVTSEDARRALRDHFCVDDLRLLVVSNPEGAKAALKGLGPVEVKEIQ